MDTLFLLRQLHADIAARVQVIRGDRADWPCGRGCGSCCRHLAGMPRLTAVEWQPLRDALAGWSPARRLEIRRKTAELARRESMAPALICPLLEEATDTCPVYLQRPVACRTHGFYVQRDKGLYCRDIESRVAAGGWADVVWGNQEAIDHRLSRLGESRTLSDWLADWDDSGVRGAENKKGEEHRKNDDA
ncbi:MAG TPA: YkgJ family cysteine cluster protein [Accumulibacter sp.]|jgi:Fe-S-cluster containining protein|nr:YkgJ family cysteine cluster protein [Accumulibacter sp.]HQC79238.1 YkgJ family cysteine cluster protein [Accumulibacter sp.]